MLDKELRPWLLEINHSPSFSTDTPFDRKVKMELIRDTITLLHLHPKNKQKYKNKKKNELQKRVLTGKQVKYSLEDKQNYKIKKVKEREKYESKHLGGFTLIYPNDSIEKYKPFINEASNIWEEFTGCKKHIPRKQSEEESKLQKQKSLTNPKQISSRNNAQFQNSQKQAKQPAKKGSEKKSSSVLSAASIYGTPEQSEHTKKPYPLKLSSPHGCPQGSQYSSTISATGLDLCSKMIHSKDSPSCTSTNAHTTHTTYNTNTRTHYTNLNTNTNNNVLHNASGSVCHPSPSTLPSHHVYSRAQVHSNSNSSSFQPLIIIDKDKDSRNTVHNKHSTNRTLYPFSQVQLLPHFKSNNPTQFNTAGLPSRSPPNLPANLKKAENDCPVGSGNPSNSGSASDNIKNGKNELSQHDYKRVLHSQSQNRPNSTANLLSSRQKLPLYISHTPQTNSALQPQHQVTSPNNSNNNNLSGSSSHHSLYSNVNISNPPSYINITNTLSPPTSASTFPNTGNAHYLSKLNQNGLAGNSNSNVQYCLNKRVNVTSSNSNFPPSRHHLHPQRHVNSSSAIRNSTHTSSNSNMHNSHLHWNSSSQRISNFVQFNERIFDLEEEKELEKKKKTALNDIFKDYVFGDKRNDEINKGFEGTGADYLSMSKFKNRNNLSNSKEQITSQRMTTLI
jgi:hypothetical protein